MYSMHPATFLQAVATRLAASWPRLLPLALGLLLMTAPLEARATSALYPDLRTLPPRDLRFDTEPIQGATHYVLRFSNGVWNAGQGRLELRGESSGATGRTRVYQRIYDDAGSFLFEILVGEFAYHPEHGHWHFEKFAAYELWTKADYDNWLASGRIQGQAQRRGTKTTFCIIDTDRVSLQPDSPRRPVYNRCGQDLQGLSVGWGDTYKYTLPEQWIDLGLTPLPNGSYVLRSVADPDNQLHESANRSDSGRESAQANEAVTVFAVQAGRIKVVR